MRRDKLIALKLSEAERQLLKGIAEARDTTVSEIIRHGALAEAQRWLDAQQQEERNEDD